MSRFFSLQFLYLPWSCSYGLVNQCKCFQLKRACILPHLFSYVCHKIFLKLCRNVTRRHLRRFAQIEWRLLFYFADALRIGTHILLHSCDSDSKVSNLW